MGCIQTKSAISAENEILRENLSNMKSEIEELKATISNIIEQKSEDNETLDELKEQVKQNRLKFLQLQRVIFIQNANETDKIIERIGALEKDFTDLQLDFERLETNDFNYELTQMKLNFQDFENLARNEVSLVNNRLDQLETIKSIYQNQWIEMNSEIRKLESRESLTKKEMRDLKSENTSQNKQILELQIALIKLEMSRRQMDDAEETLMPKCEPSYESENSSEYSEIENE